MNNPDISDTLGTFCNLSGKKALVTGGTGGIGQAICIALKQAGAEVILHGTRLEKTEEIAAKYGVHPAAADLSHTQGRASLFGITGPVDILVNNAGITRDGLFMRQKEEDWQDVLEVNLTAAVHLCKLNISYMQKSRWGRIVNISSILASTGNTGQTSYVAAKAALEAFGKSLAKECGRRNVTLNAIAPGFIDTPMTEKLPEPLKAEYLSRTALGRLGTPEEVAAAVRFLASKEASYITGTTLHINGGMY